MLSTRRRWRLGEKTMAPRDQERAIRQGITLLSSVQVVTMSRLSSMIVQVEVRRFSNSRRGATKWLMRQAKSRGWRNWEIFRPFRLPLFHNFPLLCLSSLYFEASCFDMFSSIARTFSMPSVAAVSYSSRFAAFYSVFLGFGGLSRHSHEP